jgi:hypothetical protein
MRLNQRMIVAGLASVAILPTAALADSFTIHSGETVTTPKTLSITGDVGRIELGGTVSIFDLCNYQVSNCHPTASAIRITSGGVTIENAGTISSEGLSPPKHGEVTLD